MIKQAFASRKVSFDSSNTVKLLPAALDRLNGRSMLGNLGDKISISAGGEIGGYLHIPSEGEALSKNED